MPDGYESHRDYMGKVRAGADDRQKSIEKALREAFSAFIEKREVDVVVFSDMGAHELAAAMLARPLILKPLLATCNIAARAIERDLGIRNLDTYKPRLTRSDAQVIAGYVKPFLPSFLEIPSMSRLDRVSYIDKEVRKSKGGWERNVVAALNRGGGRRFHKRLFAVDGESFELDAAYPEKGEVAIGVDIKRIEARRDIHKRCDEIVNKATKLKAAFPKAKFGAVIYYPFVSEHVNIQSRLRSPNIDGVVFASQSAESVENAVKLLLHTL